MSVDELQSGFLRLVKVLYSAEETHERRQRFWKQVRTSPNFRLQRERRKVVLNAKSRDVFAVA